MKGYCVNINDPITIVNRWICHPESKLSLLSNVSSVSQFLSESRKITVNHVIGLHMKQNTKILLCVILLIQRHKCVSVCVEGNVNWSSTVVRHSSPGQTDTSLDRQVLTLDRTWLPDEQLRQHLWVADTAVGELTMNNYYFTSSGCIWFSMYPLRARHIKCLAVSSLHHIQVMLYYEWWM